MSERARVSVLISNHNYRDWVRGAVASALEQTYADVQVVVCDDGSTDGSLELIEELARQDHRVTVVAQENAGQGAALTAAAERAQGDILCFLDADDEFLPTKVERVVRMFESSPEAGLATHRVAAVDGAGRFLQEMPQFASVRGGDLRDEVLGRGGRWVAAPSSGLSLRAKWKSAVFPIPDELRTGADAFIFGLMPLLAPVVVSDEVLTRYRIHGTNAFGTSSPDLATAQTALRELELVNRLVNERLQGLGESVRVDLEDNLLWHQQRATVALLEGDETARKLSSEAARRIRHDDLWPAPVRMGLSALYAVAPFMPVKVRARWLGAAFGLSTLKSTLGRLIRR